MSAGKGEAGQGAATKLPSTRQLDMLWERTNGKAWEPDSGLNHPFVAALIDGGWVKVCTMRCGFEAFDTGLNWSNAARAYFAALADARAALAQVPSL